MTVIEGVNDELPNQLKVMLKLLRTALVEVKVELLLEALTAPN